MNAFRMADFPAAVEWINCEPLAMAEQRGRVVALVFWSAGSAYCHNLLTDIQQVSARYSESLTVIAVHTPKFEAEREARLALKTVNRLGFRLPAVHDPAFVLWQQFEVTAWPTIVLLDPLGQPARSLVGDDCRGELDRAIHELLDQAGHQERVYEHLPPSLRPEVRLPLAFPSGVAVTANHLYVADSAHHRILECTHDGRILRQFGSGTPGHVDGNSAESSFQHPRGLCVVRDSLYVADTGNHALRRITLLNGETDTLAGNGQRGVLAGTVGGPADSIPLDTPWAVAGSLDKLYIAMAAAQQVWEYDQTKRTMRVLAGTGQLGFADGSGERALLAQPASLALIQQTLYVADSAASAIRGIHLQGGQTHTLIGQGMFDFGDQDGARHTALLQYPLALALDAKAPQLWIVDSYNNQLKSLRLGGGELRRFEVAYRLHEPAALAASPGTLWLANTNAHEMLRIDIDSAQVKRLPIGE